MNTTSLKLPPAIDGLRQQARTRWSAFAPRERLALVVMGCAIAALLLWLLAIQPAWRVARDAPAQIDRLDAQLREMQIVARESAGLRDTAPVSPAQAQEALRSATTELGAAARLSLQGDRAVLTLTGVAPEALTDWLQQARSAARARPVEAQLMRAGNGYTGTLVLTLGSAP